MQIIDGSEAKGFYFYGPIEWTVSNYGDISAAYASSIDYNSTVTYTEVSAPAGVLAANGKHYDGTVAAIEQYFEASKAEIPDGLLISEPDKIEKDTAFVFGNADMAVQYIYQLTYPDENPDDEVDTSFTYKVMQVFAVYGNRFGIFTYISTLAKIGDVTRFDYHKEKIKKVNDNFKYLEKSGEGGKQPDYTPGEDGYMLVSDKSVCGFSLYVPSASEVEYSSGFVSVRLNDGAHLSLAKAMGATAGVNTYINGRKEELKKTVSDFVDLKPDLEPTTLGNLNQAVASEYTYTYNGEVYHVYQILAITTFDGFVFTYTAKDANYSQHIDVIKKICDKVTY
jgi:hypothetical protein